MNTSKDPSPDIYAMMDEVHLNAGYLLTTRVSTSKLISNMRTELNKLICEYIEADRAARSGSTPQPTARDMPEVVQSPPDPSKTGAIEQPAPSNESEFPL